MFSWGNSQNRLNYQGLFFFGGEGWEGEGKGMPQPWSFMPHLLSIHALLIGRDFVQYFFVVLYL
jgi:hypothetical protein